MPGKRPLQGPTFVDLVRSAPDRFGDRLAIIDREQGIRKTHDEFQKDVKYGPWPSPETSLPKNPLSLVVIIRGFLKSLG